jgi:hypothetical protein
VPDVLQAPLVHVMVAALHVPPVVHIAGSVSTPPEHDCPAPHSVPGVLLVVSMQACVPVMHDVTPFLHGLAGWQAWPAVHDTQLPALHTRFVPHVVPLATFAPLSVHTGLPVLHVSVPVWHGLAGTHAAPALHATQLPPMHTMLLPQLVPFGRLPDSAHTGDPVAHDVAPVLQTLLGWQLDPAAHATHDPPLHTRSVPQLVPFVRLAPVSLQPMVGEQTVTPAWQGFAGTHAGPGVHATQPPFWQTRFVPHAEPFGWLPASRQTGAPVLHAVVPRRQGMPVTLHIAPTVQSVHVPPALHTRSWPQVVPGSTLVLVSMHVGVPPEQTSMPLWQRLVGSHAAPA